MTTNLLGPVRVSAAFVEHLKRQPDAEDVAWRKFTFFEAADNPLLDLLAQSGIARNHDLKLLGCGHVFGRRRRQQTAMTQGRA